MQLTHKDGRTMERETWNPHSADYHLRVDENYIRLANGQLAYLPVRKEVK